MKFGHALLTVTLMGLFSQTALAELKPEDAIKYRKANYSVLAWNMAKIKAMAIDNEQAFDEKKVAAAANAIAAIANSGMGALYIPGSENSIGEMKTQAKPEIFTDAEGVKEVAVKFIQAANDLQKAATSGNQDAVLKAFKETGASCKACHDKYRIKS
jgi:cytochrome c556